MKPAQPAIMSTLFVLTLYPLWSLSLSVGAIALRLGRARRLGLITYCFGLAAWVTALIALGHPAAAPIAVRAVPSGMFIAAGIVHAGLDLFDVQGAVRRAVLLWSYVPALLLAAAGWTFPRWFYSEDLTTPGPVFYPLAIVLTVWTLWVFGWLFARARETDPTRTLAYRQAWVLVVACAFGALGGGGIVLGRIALGVPIAAAAPCLSVAVVLASYALLAGETGQAGRLVRQGVVYATMTAALSAIGLTIFFTLLPELLPIEIGVGREPAAVSLQDAMWIALVIFFAALPLDPLRALIVDAVGRRLFAAPTGVRDLADHAERTEVRADQAERLAEIGVLASAVAHEVRNPLGIIAAEAKLLKRAGAPEESVDALKREVARASAFVDELLRYSRPKPLAIGTIDARSAIDDAIRRVQTAMTGPGAEPCQPSIERVVDDLSGVVLEGDPEGFRDVLVILLSNAVAATADRPDAQILVSVTREEDSVVAAVEDDGPGVPKSIEERLMQPFVSGRGRDARFPGTGLGLAIANRWMQRHEGELVYDRSPALGGARFRARWPIRS